LDSNDPRRNIQHKRPDQLMYTDASASLQGNVNFDELELQQVIGGGGFGQVWRAVWNGTPVAVKVLTGSAQAHSVPRAILEEFAAEINLLKGMRHPNICLYMGACLSPPNRAIITELAAHGSLWDALRLPLSPPYIAADGVTHQAWPLELSAPDPRHGLPPGSHRIHVPPAGSWPWVLVKKVACGSARGMNYLHKGNPPVLHRDLKSANILLDESYTPKVCDFGLSRLKAKDRSMTGNCGTVQWMAPEVLANQSYNEKADVYSYGIILWELLTRECPYEDMTAIQCALAVLNRNHRPEIPRWCPPPLQVLIRSCLKKDPDERPSFTEILQTLDKMP
jgi:serine/threonine protein kinase